MFGGNKNNEANKATGQAQSPNSVNALAQGTHIEGNIKAESDFRIDGTVIGDLNCSARVVIGPTGKVKGNISCANAIIEGQFEGKLVVREVLTIKEAAKVMGDVKTDKLIVHSGALFNVTCAMGSATKLDVPAARHAVAEVHS